MSYGSDRSYRQQKSILSIETEFQGHTGTHLKYILCFHTNVTQAFHPKKEGVQVHFILLNKQKMLNVISKLKRTKQKTKNLDSSTIIS